MKYALIKSGVVENIILADAEFISIIASSWDHCVRLDEIDPCPGMGWTYENGTFSAPVESEE